MTTPALSWRVRVNMPGSFEYVALGDQDSLTFALLEYRDGEAVSALADCGPDPWHKFLLPYIDAQETKEVKR